MKNAHFNTAQWEDNKGKAIARVVEAKSGNELPWQCAATSRCPDTYYEEANLKVVYVSSSQ